MRRRRRRSRLVAGVNMAKQGINGESNVVASDVKEWRHQRAANLKT